MTQPFLRIKAAEGRRSSVDNPVSPEKVQEARDTISASLTEQQEATHPWWWRNMSPFAVKNLADAFINNRRALTVALERIKELEREKSA